MQTSTSNSMPCTHSQRKVQCVTHDLVPKFTRNKCAECKKCRDPESADAQISSSKRLCTEFGSTLHRIVSLLHVQFPKQQQCVLRKLKNTAIHQLNLRLPAPNTIALIYATINPATLNPAPESPNHSHRPDRHTIYAILSPHGQIESFAVL